LTQKVQILPEKLCNQIAAGEVIERPASVIKELVENSLDAGATTIRIEVEKGGKRLIRVTDNGCGMSRDDAFLSLERHATSKLRSESDLSRLRTLGFRGEALPSIAAISRMLLRTRQQEALEGWEIYLEGGTVRRAGAAGTPVGTTMEVRNLFFNTPARRKFLRRDETELGHIADTVTKLALARPEIQFQLAHDGRKLIDVNRHRTLPERVAQLLGPALLKEMVTVDSAADGRRLHGLISRPETSRSTAGSMFSFINGRYIRDRVVHHALREGYRNLMMKGRHPVVVLFLDMQPEQVDVNVHPTKHEVRFREQAAVHDFIAGAIRDTLRPSSWVSGGPSLPGPASVAWAGEREEFRRPASPSPTVSRETDFGSGAGVQEELTSYRPAESPPQSAMTPPCHREQKDQTGFFGGAIIIGQYRESYIICQSGDDLLLIDQHAAHERIAFEKLRTQYRASGVERQMLMFPLVLEFDFREGAVVAEHLEFLERLGFEIEPFGGTAFAVKAVPHLFSGGETERLIRDVVGELATIGKSSLVEQALDGLLMLMACHRVVRANQVLSTAEIRALLSELDKTPFNAQCPHGRPVMQRLTLTDVERMFKRT
jgi:DNA mismatch repair protein MutL